jgi:hypothetical protein
MLNKILAAISLRRPKNPPPITEEEWAVFNKSKEILDALSDDMQYVDFDSSLYIRRSDDSINLDLLRRDSYLWPTAFGYMDFRRPELGGELYKIAEKKIAELEEKKRKEKLAEFLGE